MSSGVKRAAAPPAPGGPLGQTKKPVGAFSANGSGPAPLTYSSGEPSDDVNMNEVDENVTLEVCLPSGKSTSITVDSNIPMIDLLVHLAGKSKVNPSGHTLQVLDEETGKPMEYKPNQTIGSLGATTVYIVSKNKKPDWSKATKANKAAKAFEITQRFTINLPGGQKAVMRVPPQLTLEQVFAKVCQDKSLDTRRYTLQHPTNPMAQLNLKATIQDSRLSEINLINAGASSAAVEASQSLPDLSRPLSTASQDPGSWYMPGAGETKKKRGFLSFLKKDKKFKPHESNYGVETSSTSSHQMTAAQPRRPTTPPVERRSTDNNITARPKTMYVGSVGPKESDIEIKAPPRGVGKKRPAPAPPQASAAAPTESEMRASRVAATAAAPATKQTVSNDSASSREALTISVKPGVDPGLSRLHSRNSSDSSGYHELTLSGAESPEAGRLPTTFKTSIDTTSIESSDNLNGDSGIQELSPVAESSRLMDDSRSLPQKSMQGRQLQTQTLDRPEKMKPMPSTKKKKAPPPPPKAKPAPVQEEPRSSPEISVPNAIATVDIDIPPPLLPPPEDMSESAEPRDEVEDEDDESGEPFNLDDILEGVIFDEEPLRMQTPRDEDDEDEGDMAMVETESVLSEDVQVVDDFRSRPCEFIPPPPPEEPPPDMGFELQFVDKGTVVGDDNASLAPASLKNSPVPTHRRTESRTSICSIDTVEGLSLAFQQTIALGQEALENEGYLEGDGVYKNEMARFVEQMTKLTTPGGGGDSSNNTSISLPDTESVSDTGSVIQTGEPYHVREDSRDSQSSLSSLGRPGDSSSMMGNEDEMAGYGLYGNCVQHNAFAMTEEIHAPVETVPPPLEFQNSMQDEEEEEEEVTTITEEYIIPVGPSGLDYSSAVKVSEQETHQKVAKHTESAGPSESSGVFRAEPVAISKKPPPMEMPKEVVPPKPKPKEEFVLTLEDLSSVSLLPLRPKMYTEPKKAPVSVPVPVPQKRNEEPSMEPSKRSHVHLAYTSNRGHLHAVDADSGSLSDHFVDDVANGNHLNMQGVGQSRSVVGAGEIKPASLMHLPTMRITGSMEPAPFSDDERSRSSSMSSNDHVYRSTAKLVMGSQSQSDTSSLTDDGSERLEDTGSRRLSSASSSGNGGLDMDAARETLQQQYEQLQQQFVLWQRQLQQNQTLLVAQEESAGNGDNINTSTLQTLQLQMQMQQQMMQQLQRSMQALNLQQQATQPDSTPLLPAPPPPPATPPSPPPAPKVGKAEAAKPKQRPPPNRFEPQLDPREELMIAIRTFGGRSGLNTVPVKSTKWVNNNN